MSLDAVVIIEIENGKPIAVYSNNKVQVIFAGRGSEDDPPLPKMEDVQPTASIPDDVKRQIETMNMIRQGLGGEKS